MLASLLDLTIGFTAGLPVGSRLEGARGGRGTGHVVEFLTADLAFRPANRRASLRAWATVACNPDDAPWGAGVLGGTAIIGGHTPWRIAALKFQPDTLAGINNITHVDVDSLRVNGEPHSGGLLIPWVGRVQRW